MPKFASLSSSKWQKVLGKFNVWWGFTNASQEPQTESEIQARNFSLRLFMDWENAECTSGTVNAGDIEPGKGFGRLGCDEFRLLHLSLTLNGPPYIFTARQ